MFESAPGDQVVDAGRDTHAAGTAFWNENYFRVSAALPKRPACDFSALARVSNQSAIAAKPSSRAVFAIPGYMSVYSWVSPCSADLRFTDESPIGMPVAGSPTDFR